MTNSLKWDTSDETQTGNVTHDFMSERVGTRLVELDAIYYFLETANEFCLILELFGVALSGRSGIAYDFANFTGINPNMPPTIKSSQYHTNNDWVEHDTTYWSVFFVGTLPFAMYKAQQIQDFAVPDSHNWYYRYEYEGEVYYKKGSDIVWFGHELADDDGYRRYYFFRDFICKDLPWLMGVLFFCWLAAKILGSSAATALVMLMMKVKSNEALEDSIVGLTDELAAIGLTQEDIGTMVSNLSDSLNTSILPVLEQILSAIGLKLRL
jgi:hypothetical protein